MNATDSEGSQRDIDLVFEWNKICHACGEQKRFNRLICDECRERHNV